MITVSPNLVPGLSFISPWNAHYTPHEVVMVPYFIHEVMITPFLSFEYSECAEWKWFDPLWSLGPGHAQWCIMDYNPRPTVFREDSRVRIQPESQNNQKTKAKTNFHNQLPSIIGSSSPPCLSPQVQHDANTPTDVTHLWMQRLVKNERERSAAEMNCGLTGMRRERRACACACVCSYIAWM